MVRLIMLLTFLIIKWQVTHCQQSLNPYPWLKSNNKWETIATRIKAPPGFQRVKVKPRSFAKWLRGLPLLPEGTAVKDYTGRVRVTIKDTTLAAVVDYDIKGRKLEQCMDVIIRLRAEYLRSQNCHQDIAFFLPGGFLLKWTDWIKGLRPKFHGIRVALNQSYPPDSSRSSFEKYLWEIFYYSYTQTAYVGYPEVKPENLQIGDFFVKKGRRSHAVLVVDIAEDKNSKKIILIGHGDTPARQFYLLNFKKNMAWFPVNLSEKYLPLPIKKKLTWEGLRRF